MENEILEEVVEEQPIEEVEEVFKTRLVQIKDKLHCDFVEYLPEEKLDVTRQIYITDEDRLQIGVTKCFDLENNCIVDYDNTIDKIIEQKNELRTRRKLICFPIVNRGQLWYDRLTKVQKEELNTWYDAWLDITEAMTEPEVPEFLYEELEKFYLVKEEPVIEPIPETDTEEPTEEQINDETSEEIIIEEPINEENTEQEVI